MVTHGLRCLDSNLGHPNVRLVKVLYCLGGIIGRLVAHIANAALGDQLDIGNLATLGGEVFPKVSLGNVGWQALDKDS